MKLGVLCARTFFYYGFKRLNGLIPLGFFASISFWYRCALYINQLINFKISIYDVLQCIHKIELHEVGSVIITTSHYRSSRFSVAWN